MNSPHILVDDVALQRAFRDLITRGLSSSEWLDIDNGVEFMPPAEPRGTRD